MEKFNVSNIALKRRAAWLSLIVGLSMFAAKISAYMITGSTAIFSDAAESVVHVAATSMALFSIYLSSKPADESHLYGHGNIEYFSAGIEGLLIIVAAVTIIYSSLIALLQGVSMQQLDIGTSIIALAGIVNLFLGLYLIRQGKKTNSLTLIADGKHVLTDSYTSIAVVAGLVLVLITGYLVLDPIIAIVVAFNILFTGYKLIRESISGLMNETDISMLESITNLFEEIKKDYWIDIHHLRFRKSGEIVFVDFHLILPYYFTIEQSHHEETYIRDSLRKIFPATGIRVHMDYCKPDCCKYCNYNKCTERKDEKKIEFSWDARKLIGNPVYEID
ncbi:MAG TPA: cation diffusion facilitator family transporter [Melioribacteraceae bacterium]|nr:cation diffusion facilitator family transporter [Melioribacteraceae bacterium]